MTYKFNYPDNLSPSELQVKSIESTANKFILQTQKDSKHEDCFESFCESSLAGFEEIFEE